MPSTDPAVVIILLLYTIEIETNKVFRLSLKNIDVYKIHKPIGQNVVPICVAGDGLFVVDTLTTVTVGILKLEPEASVAAEKLVKGIKGVIEATVLSVVVPFPGIKCYIKKTRIPK